jgi:hypothetical protein
VRERCQLVLLIAFGESILAVGATYGSLAWNAWFTATLHGGRAPWSRLLAIAAPAALSPLASWARRWHSTPRRWP